MFLHWYLCCCQRCCPCSYRKEALPFALYTGYRLGGGHQVFYDVSQKGKDDASTKRGRLRSACEKTRRHQIPLRGRGPARSGLVCNRFFSEVRRTGRTSCRQATQEEAITAAKTRADQGLRQAVHL